MNDRKWTPTQLPEGVCQPLANALKQEGVDEDIIHRITGCFPQDAVETSERVEADLTEEGFHQGQQSPMPDPTGYQLEQMPLLPENMSDPAAETDVAESAVEMEPPMTKPRTATSDDPRHIAEVRGESLPPESSPVSSDPAMDHDLWREREPVERDDPVEHLEAKSLPGVSGWRMIGASRRGRAHAHEGKYREDSLAFATEAGWHFLVVADGAGSAILSRVGAKEAVNAALQSMIRSVRHEDEEEMVASPDMPEVVRDALAAAALRLKQEASDRHLATRGLATTLLVLAHRPSPDGHFVVTGQVGDGSLVAWSPTEHVLTLGKPEHGRFAGETQFLTSISGDPDLRDRVHIEDHARPDVCVFLVMTDGVADDFFPLDQELEKLVKSLAPILTLEDDEARDQLLELLDYRKRASFDDRTLVILASSDAERTIGQANASHAE